MIPLNYHTYIMNIQLIGNIINCLFYLILFRLNNSFSLQNNQDFIISIKKNMLKEHDNLFVNP